MFDSFNEVEATPDSSVPELELTEVIISSYKRSRRKGKREADLDGLPARVFNHELTKEELAEKSANSYQFYHTLDKERQDLKISGCWIHCRRPYAELIKSVGATAAKVSIAAEAYAMITEIMHLDNSLDDLSNSDCKKQRQLVLKEKVDACFAWVKLKYSQVTHNSVIGKALAYSINQEEYIRMFLTDGRIPMNNNYAKQAIRPFTIARKNFVLMESDYGANASAMIFSIAETAKVNNLNTYEYFEHLLSEIPKHQNTEMFHINSQWYTLSKRAREKQQQLVLKPKVDDFFK